ncbi:Hypothetical protein CINCED_3A025731 [Cinara cedri]|uniref:Uncharacterized protein n=1 Tax=Cinara cedri TaxID=506608 RepID=A0A5E4MHP0_9HEMI|nr:Hypothetical protein CINCED_3A025731 [Cinara cedri]
MSNNATYSPGTFKIRSSQNSVTNAKGKKSKHSFGIQPKTSKRKIDNNIKEKLFQSKLNAYKAKQNELLTNFAELSQLYYKCVKLSKTVCPPKSKYVGDIETAVNY